MTDKDAYKSLTDAVQILAEAIGDIHEIAKANPLDRASLGIRELCLKAVKEADETLKGFE